MAPNIYPSGSPAITLTLCSPSPGPPSSTLCGSPAIILPLCSPSPRPHHLPNPASTLIPDMLPIYLQHQASPPPHPSSSPLRALSLDVPSLHQNLDELPVYIASFITTSRLWVRYHVHDGSISNDYPYKCQLVICCRARSVLWCWHWTSCVMLWTATRSSVRAVSVVATHLCSCICLLQTSLVHLHQFDCWLLHAALRQV